MAKPTNAIKGFIEVLLDEEPILLALHNIISVKKQGEGTVITFHMPLDTYNRKSESVRETYEKVLTLMREAAQ